MTKISSTFLWHRPPHSLQRSFLSVVDSDGNETRRIQRNNSARAALYANHNLNTILGSSMMQFHSFDTIYHLQSLLKNSRLYRLMCERHTCDCPVCGKEYLIFVKLCPNLNPATTSCSGQTMTVKDAMAEGLCPSMVCPNSRSGGCVVS